VGFVIPRGADQIVEVSDNEIAEKYRSCLCSRVEGISLAVARPFDPQSIQHVAIKTSDLGRPARFGLHHLLH
jgi:hypothetical protein